MLGKLIELQFESPIYPVQATGSQIGNQLLQRLILQKINMQKNHRPKKEFCSLFISHIKVCEKTKRV